METIRKTVYLAITLLIISALTPSANAQLETSKLSPEISHLLAEASSKEYYSRAGAVILLRDGRMTVGSNGLYNLTGHIIGKILDEKAASDYGQISIYFNSYYREVTLDFARTLSRAGEVFEISKDAIQIKSLPGQLGVKRYTDMKVLTFSLPTLDKGSVFEYQVTIRQKKPILENRWTMIFGFNHLLKRVSLPYIPRIDPVLKSRLILKVPKGEKFDCQVKNIKAFPTVKKEAHHTIYTWETKDLPAIPIEMYMPPISDLTSNLYLTSLRKWEEVDQWASAHFLPKIETTKEIKAKAREIIRESKTEEQKIKALFYFMTSKIEYVQADLNRGGYNPHFATEILRNRYGCCKDHVVLFISMLNALGIAAYPALLTPYPYHEVNKEIPSFGFSHLIVYIPQKTGDLWLDTTSGVSQFPQLPWQNQGRLAFVVDGKGGRLLKTPSTRPESNKGILRIDWRFENETVQNKMTIEGEGAISDNLKSFLKRLPRAQWDIIIGSLIKSRFPNAQVQKIEFSDLENPRLPFKAIAVCEFKGLWNKKMKAFHYGGHALPLMSFFTTLHSLPLAEERSGDYVLGFKFRLIEECSCLPPAKDFRPLILPQDVSLDTRLFSFRRVHTRKGEFVKTKSEFTLKQSRIKLKEYKEFCEGIQDVLRKSEWLLAFLPKPDSPSPVGNYHKIIGRWWTEGETMVIEELDNMLFIQMNRIRGYHRDLSGQYKYREITHADKISWDGKNLEFQIWMPSAAGEYEVFYSLTLSDRNTLSGTKQASGSPTKIELEFIRR